METKSHIGNPQRSRVLKLTRDLIFRKRGATGAEIAHATGSTAVHSDVHALRVFYGFGGAYEVLPAEYIGLSPARRKIYRYRMILKNRKTAGRHHH